MKLIRLSLFVILACVCSFAQPAKVRNHAESTHHIVKGTLGFKKVGSAAKNRIAIPVKNVTVGTVVTGFDILESGVDQVGVGFQLIADGLDMGVAAPLEALPKPLNEAGVLVHEIYLGIDAAGQFLAK